MDLRQAVNCANRPVDGKGAKTRVQRPGAWVFIPHQVVSEQMKRGEMARRDVQFGRKEVENIDNAPFDERNLGLYSSRASVLMITVSSAS